MKRYIYSIIVILILSICSAGICDKKWWRLYFTYPVQKKNKKLYNPERALIREINNAEKSFYGAFYDISSPRIIKTLIRAKRRGLDIRLVTETDNIIYSGIEKLIASGIPVVPDGRNGLMHHKFAVIDKKTIWTGSYNLTTNGLRNDNNAIKIQSSELADIYLNEFNEMYKYKIFGNRKEIGPFKKIGKKYYVKKNKTWINVYFSPEDNIEKIILKRIKKAKKAIHFMAFSFTSNRIGEAMIDMHKRGVKVYGIFEKRGSNSKYSQYVKMKIEGLKVKRDRNRYVMHHKVIIVDREYVLTGSYNFSLSANKKNDENILIIGNREIVKEYLGEFHRLYN